MFGLKLPKSDEEILKLSTSETWVLVIVTGGWYGFWWCACLMRAINKQLGRPVFNVNRKRNTIAFSVAGLVLAFPFLLVAILLFPLAGAILIYVFFGVMLILFIGVPTRLLYQITSRIHEIEIAQDKSELIRPWLAIVLFFQYYLDIPYLQDHVNKLQWKTANNSDITVVLK